MSSSIVNKLVSAIDKKAAKSKRKHKVKVVDQASALHESVLALLAAENQTVPADRRVTRKAALTVVRRSLNRTRGLQFSVREYQALRDLGQFISLSRSTDPKLLALASNELNRDLLPIAHPFSTRSHAMTASALRRSRAHWLSTDPLLEEELRPVVASAFGDPDGSPSQVHALARLHSIRDRYVPREVADTDSQLALVAVGIGGNSSAARSARANLQRRDGEGQFAEMGGGLRFLKRGLDGVVSWVTGRLVANDPNSESFDIETPEGNIYRVPANAARGVKAVLDTPDSDVAARTKTGDVVLDEADVKSLEAPAGWKKMKKELVGGDSYEDEDGDFFVVKISPKENGKFDPNEGKRVERALNVLNKHNAAETDPAKQRVMEGANPDNSWDKSKPFFIVMQRGKQDGAPVLKDIGLVQDWAGVQKAAKRAEPDVDKAREEEEVKAKLKQADWEALQAKKKKFAENRQVAWEKHVAEKQAANKKIVDDNVDLNGDELPGNWRAAEPNLNKVKPLDPYQELVRSRYGTDADGKKVELDGSETIPLSSNEFVADPVFKHAKPGTDGEGFLDNFVVHQNRENGKFVFKDKRYGDKELDSPADLLEVLKARGPKEKERLLAVLDDLVEKKQIEKNQDTIDKIKAAESRAELDAALAGDASIEALRQTAADSVWADLPSKYEKDAQKAHERLMHDFYGDTELEIAFGVLAKPLPLEPSPDVDIDAVEKFAEPSDFELMAPKGAYKMNLDGFEPEGAAEGQESSDYTDDPVALANRYQEHELKEALAQALVGKSDPLDALADEFDDELGDFDPDEDLGDAPGKPGPKKKKDSQKKQAKDAGAKTMKEQPAASGFGMLEFNAGSEYVPAEALYKALEEQGVDAELYAAQLYDARAGEDKNVPALKKSRRTESVTEEQPGPAVEPDLADVFPTQEDLAEMEDVDTSNEGDVELEVPEMDAEQTAAFQLAQALADYKKQYNQDIKDGKVDEAVEAVYNDFIGADPGDKDYMTQLEKHFDIDKFGTADDPFRAVWGAWMMEGPDNAQKNVNPAIRQFAMDSLGMSEDEADELNLKIIDTYGNPQELEEAVNEIEANPELLNSTDSKYATAQALLKMSAVNSGTNSGPLWQVFDLADDEAFMDAVSEEGNVISLRPESWQKSTGDVNDLLGDKAGKGQAYVFTLDSGNGTTTPISDTSELVWGQYVVENIVTQADANGNEYKIVRLRKLTQAENIAINEDGDYTPYLLPNENLDLPDGYNLPDTDPYVPEYNGVDGNEVAAGFPEGFTDSPMYIAENWDTETLVDSLRIAVEPDVDEEGAGYAVLEYPLDGGTDILVSGQAIRDALQIQGFDTNAFLRDMAGKKDPEIPTPEEVKEMNVPAEPASKNTTEAIGSSISNPVDISDWKKVTGKLGSNEGGVYEAPDGQRYYVKVAKSPLHAGNEVLASALYRKAGVDGADTFFGRDEAGNLVTVSPWLSEAQQDMPDMLNSPAYRKMLQDGFAIDAWLANWDVAGLAMDNVVSVDGKPYRVDAGGALMTRAMGKLKGDLFGEKADEWESLRDEKMNPQSAKVFGDMDEAQLKASAAKLLDITEKDINDLAFAAFPDDPVLREGLVNKLVLRRQDILERAGLTGKDTTVTVNNLTGPEPEDMTDIQLASKLMAEHGADASTTEAKGMAVGEVEDLLQNAQNQFEKGNKQSALDYLENAADIIDGSEPASEGPFPSGPKAQQALDSIENMIDQLKTELDKEKTAPAPTAGEDPEDWSNETVNLYEVQNLIDDETTWATNQEDVDDLQDRLDDVYRPMAEARQYTNAGDGSWTDLNNPPADVVEHIKDAVPPLKALRENLKGLVRIVDSDADVEYNKPFNAAIEQVDDLLKDIENKLKQWEPEEDDDELKPEDAYVIADDYLKEAFDALEEAYTADGWINSDLEAKNEVGGLLDWLDQIKADGGFNNPADIEEFRKRLDNSINYAETANARALSDKLKDIYDGLLPVLDVASKDKVKVVEKQEITPDEVADPVPPKVPTNEEPFYDPSQPPQVEDGNVNVKLLVEPTDLPPLGTDEGPIDLAEYGIPNIVKEGTGQDGLYEIDIQVPHNAEAMKNFVDTWNKMRKDMAGPYASPTSQKATPENMFGDAYADAPSTPDSTPPAAAAEEAASPADKNLSADGKTPVAEGMKVRSAKTGEVGVITKLDVYKKGGKVFPDYAWVKFDGKKDKQLKSTKTLEIVDDGGFPEGPTEEDGGSGGTTPPDKPAPTPAPEAPAAEPETEPEAPTETTGEDGPPIVIDTSGTLDTVHEQIEKAIKDKKLIQFVYNGKERLVRPFSMWNNPKKGTKNLTGEDLSDGGKKKNFTTELIEQYFTPSAEESGVPEQKPFREVKDYTMTGTTADGDDWSSYKGTFSTTPKLLKKILGEPNIVGTPDGKTQMQWNLKFQHKDGSTKTVSIYDYKEGYTIGDDNFVDWHVGGADQQDFELVDKFMKENAELDTNFAFNTYKEKVEPVSAEQVSSAEKILNTPAGQYDADTAKALKEHIKNNDLFDVADIKVKDLQVGDYLPYAFEFAEVLSHEPGDGKQKSYKKKMKLRLTNGKIIQVAYSNETVIKKTRRAKDKEAAAAVKPSTPPAPTKQELKEEAESYKQIVAAKEQALAAQKAAEADSDTDVEIKPVGDSKAPTPPNGQKYLVARNGGFLYKDVEVTDLNGKKGTVVGFPGAKGYENYVNVLFEDGTKKVRSASALNGGPLKGAPVPKVSGPGKDVEPVLTEADWAQTPFSQNGIKSLEQAIGHVKAGYADGEMKEPAEAVKGRVGTSTPVDSGDVEDLHLRLHLMRDKDKSTKVRGVFKLTAWAGDALVEKIQKDHGLDLKDTGKLNSTKVETEDYTIEFESGITIPKYVHDQDGVIAVGDGAKYSNPYGGGFIMIFTDKATGAKIRVYRSGVKTKTLKELQTSGSNAQSWHNRVDIQIPADMDDKQVAESMGRAMRIAGVNASRPATPEDVRVLNENRVISIFGKEIDPSENLVGPTRAQRLKQIEKKLGLTFDEMWATPNSPSYGGAAEQLEYRTSPAVAKWIMDHTGTKALTHLSGTPGNTASEAASWVYDLLLDGAGLKAATARFTEGLPSYSHVNSGQQSDLDNGSGEYVFTKPKGDLKPYGVNGDQYVFWHFDAEKLFTRLDFWANRNDQYGKRRFGVDPMGEIKAGSTYEVIFKRGITWADLAFISVSPDVRKILVERLTASGIDPKEKFGVDSWEDLVRSK